MIGKKINQLATELAPVSTDLTIIGDPISGVSKKITLAQLGAIFSGAVSFYDDLASFPATGDINVIYCAKDTKKLYLWSGSAYVEVFPAQALLDTYQLRSEKGNANGYASLDSGGKVPVSQLPSSIMEYKGMWNAATNTPTLANGTGDTGDVYICNVAGTVDFGAGAITFAVGDYVIYSGSIWQRSSGAVGTVTSVAASITGDAIGITGSPVTTSGTLALAFAGTSSQYINGAGNLTTFPTLTGYVPYTGATTNVNLGEFGITSGYYGFDLTPTNTPTTQGTMYWNADKESVDIIMNGVTGSVLQDSFYNVKNQTGSSIPKGTVVRASGTVGASGRILIAPFLADGTYDSKLCIGVTSEAIADGADGKVTAFGAIRQIDTSAFANGTILYASPSVSGGFTSTEPTNPNNIVTVAIVIYSDVNNGEIFVRPTFVDNAADIAAALGYTPQAQLNGTGFVKASGTTISYDNSTYYLASNPNAYIPLTALSAGAGISYNNTTGVIASTITQYTDAMARAAISLTTTGTSGAATYNSTTGVLNVPQYAPDLSGYVPTSRTLTINGTSFDLSANRSWSVGTVTSVGLSSATSGVTIGSSPITTSGTITLAIATASGSQQGLLSSTDWTTFNNKQNALTNPVTGTGTTNYLPKFTGTSTIGNSDLITDASGNLSIAQGNAPTQALNLYRAGSTQTVMAVGNSNTGLNGTYFGVDANGNGIMNTTGAFANIFSTNGSERMYLNASGNLGLGVTPSAWDTTGDFKALQVGSGFGIYGRASGDQDRGGLFANAYHDGTGWKYISTGNATRYDQTDGSHLWQTAPSGTAGNAISFTQAMTLNASGNLSVGNTNDTYKLDVSGTGRFSGDLLVKNTSTIARIDIEAPSANSKNIFFKSSGNADNSVRLAQNANTNDFIIATGDGTVSPTTRLTIASTGAATFSSSVTATFLTSTLGAMEIQGSANAVKTLYINRYGVASGSQHRLRAENGYFEIASANSEPIVLTGGSVGIGTTSPAEQLNLMGANAYTSKIRFSYGAGATSYYTNFGYNSDGNKVYLQIADGSSAANIMTWNYNGNVGIGTTSPSGQLHLKGASGLTNFGDQILQIESSTSNYSGIVFSGTSGSNAAIRSEGASTMTFWTASGTSYTERMRITSGGNVEINTGSIKTGEPDTGYGRAAVKIGARNTGEATSSAGHIPVNIDGTVYFINLYSDLP